MRRNGFFRLLHLMEKKCDSAFGTDEPIKEFPALPAEVCVCNLQSCQIRKGRQGTHGVPPRCWTSSEGLRPVLTILAADSTPGMASGPVRKEVQFSRERFARKEGDRAVHNFLGN